MMTALRHIQVQVMSLYLGFSSTISQILLMRELLTTFRGNELIIGFIYASWFLGIFTGARCNRDKPRGDLENQSIRSMILLPILLAVSIYGAHALPFITGRTAGTFYPVNLELFFSLILTFPVSFPAGFMFPPLVTLLSDRENEGAGGSVYFLEASGSFAGGIIFSFLMVDRLNPLEIISILFILAFLIIAVTMRPVFSVIIIFPVILLFTSAGIEKNFFSIIWKAAHPGTLLEYQRTRYQKVSVARHENITEFYGDGIYLFSLPDDYEARPLIHLVRSLNEKGGNVLLFSVSPGHLPDALTKDNIYRVYLCENDESLWGIIRHYWGPGDYTVILGDIIDYFNSENILFDCIVIASPGPENLMLNRFYTGEFYDLCRKHLSEKGTIITGLAGFSNYMSPLHRRYFLSIYQAFEGVFPDHLISSGDPLYLIGGKDKGDIPSSPEALIRRYEYVKGKDNASELRMLFENSQVSYLESLISQERGGIVPNSIVHPSGYWNLLMHTLFMEQSGLLGLTRIFIAVPAVLLFISLAAIGNIRKRFSNTMSYNGSIILLAGHINISTMLIIMILYQSSHGILYHRISLITALFMAGLAAGGRAGNMKKRLPLAALLSGSIAVLVLVLVYTGTMYRIFFWPIIPLSGFFAGAIFPTLFRSCRDESYHDRASVLDAMDHFGSILGSVITVLVTIPAIGLQGTAIINLLLGILALLLYIRRESLSSSP